MTKALVAVLLLLLTAWPAEARKTFRCRDAVTGQYVTKAYVKAHPERTVCERVR